MARAEAARAAVERAEAARAVELTVSLGFLNSRGVVIPSLGMGAEASAGESKNS